MHRDSEGKSKREGRMLPKRVLMKALKKCRGDNAFQIVKKAGADEKERESKSTQVCKDKFE